MDNRAGAAGAASGAAAVGAVETRIRAGAGAAATGAAGSALSNCAMGAAVCPSSWCTRSLIGPDKSVLQLGQTNRIGSRAISGVTSMEYLAPHWHCTFIGPQGL